MTLFEIHQWFAWAVIVLNAVAGLWVLLSHWVVGLRARPMWLFTVAAQTMLAAEVVLGVAVMQLEQRTVGGLHTFYGFLAFAVVGLLYSYRSQAERWQYLLYGFGGLFLMGLALRAATLS